MLWIQVLVVLFAVTYGLAFLIALGIIFFIGSSKLALAWINGDPKPVKRTW